MIKNYSDYIKESLLDKMVGPTEEEILKTNPTELLEIGMDELDLDMIKLAIENGADINRINGSTLIPTIGYENSEIAIYLIKQGVKISGNFSVLLKRALGYSNFELADILIELGADIHTGDEFLLRTTVWSGDLKTTKYLISKGADVHVNNNAVIHAAISSSSLNIVKYLIDEHNVVETEEQKKVCLRIAEREHSTKVLTYLKKIFK